MNNKYYLFLSIILSIYAVFSIPVSAEELEKVSDIVSVSDLPASVKDSSGRVIEGSCLYINDNTYSSSYIDTPLNQLYFSVVGSPGVYLYITRESSNYGYNHFFRLKLSTNNGGDATFYRKEFSYNQISNSNDLIDLFDDVENSNNIVNYVNNGIQSNQNEYPVTNIPIFNAGDDVSINNYLTSGDISGALNQNDVAPPPEIPYPTDITLSKTSKQNYGEKYFNPIVVSWKAGNNSNYNYQNMRFSVSYEAVYGYSKAGISNTVSSGVKNVAQHVKYQNENQTYTLGVDNLNENLTLTIAGLQLDIKNKWLNSITIYIQNEDDQNSAFVSSIKYVAYDFVTKVEDSSNTPVDDGSLGGGSSDGNSSGVGDGSIDFQSGNSNVVNNNNPTININNNNNLTGGATDNYITSAIKGALDGTSDFGDTVHNGFGLLGENGFLSAVTAMFAFVPSNIITMFTTTIGACCLMFIVGAVIWFIRG